MTARARSANFQSDSRNDCGAPLDANEVRRRWATVSASDARDMSQLQEKVMQQEKGRKNASTCDICEKATKCRKYANTLNQRRFINKANIQTPCSQSNTVDVKQTKGMNDRKVINT